MGNTRKKKGGQLKKELEMENNGLENAMELEPVVKENNNLDENLDNALEKGLQSKEKQGGDNMQLNITENDKQQDKEYNNIKNKLEMENEKREKEGGSDVKNSAQSIMESGLDIVNGALSGLTGNKVKIGGSTPLQTKLFTVLHNRSQNLKSELEQLVEQQNNVRRRTDNALSEAQGLLKQFSNYKNMGGGKKIHKKSNKKTHRRKQRVRKRRRTRRR